MTTQRLISQDDWPICVGLIAIFIVMGFIFNAVSLH